MTPPAAPLNLFGPLHPAPPRSAPPCHELVVCSLHLGASSGPTGAALLVPQVDDPYQAHGTAGQMVIFAPLKMIIIRLLIMILS